MRKRLFPIAFIAFGLSAAAAAARAPELLNMEEVFTGDDYPAVAQRNNQQGKVVVLVDVDRTGVATSCKIKESSGHVSLDEQTCALFRARARFEPARDSRGRAIAARYQRLIVWRLEGNSAPPLPRQAWLLRTTLSFGADGKMVACKVEATGVSTMDGACPETGAGSAAAVPAQPAAEAISETYFYPVEVAKVTLPADRTGATKLAQQVSAIEIDAEGRVSACQGMRYSGNATPENDACRLASEVRFAPESGAGSVVKGTIVMTLYVRRQSVT